MCYNVLMYFLFLCTGIKKVPVFFCVWEIMLAFCALIFLAGGREMGVRCCNFGDSSKSVRAINQVRGREFSKKIHAFMLSGEIISWGFKKLLSNM